MTLYRQIAWIVSLAFVVLFTGVFVESLMNTRAFLRTQLLSHAQDTATSLALSLSPVLAQKDLVSANIMASAIFDRGYYRQIKVTDSQGEIQVDLFLPDKIEGVSDWFIAWIPLPAPTGQALIMDGWNEIGQLTVTSNPGYAYLQLWNNAITKFQWFFGVGLGVLLLVLLFLRWVLAPLRQIEQQAEAICDRQFLLLDSIPRTRELRRVVLAMNVLSGKVEGFLAQQIEISERYRAQANLDAVTALWNKRYLLASLTKASTDQDGHNRIILFMVRLDQFKAYNDQFGYAAGDTLLKQFGQLFQEQYTEKVTEPLFARLGGADFALLVFSLSDQEVEAIAAAVARIPSRLSHQRSDDFHYAVHIGVTIMESAQAEISSSIMLARADTALKEAISRGANTWIVDDQAVDKASVRTESQWREILGSLMRDQSIIPHFQPIQTRASTGLLDQFEAFARFPDGAGHFYPSGVLFVTAARFGLTEELDRLIIQTILTKIKQISDGTRIIAINLSPTIALSDHFFAWLERALADLPQHLRGGLAFEVTESAAMDENSGLGQLRKKLLIGGFLFGLDRFGSGVGSFGCLRTLLPDYIKIDKKFIHGLDEEEDKRFFVRSLIEVAHTLEIKVIATGVESLAERRVLCELGVDGLQGYQIGHPQPDMAWEDRDNPWQPA